MKDMWDWYWLAVKTEARCTWDILPGPWWGKVLAAVVFALLLVIPGELDEVVALAVLKALHRRRTRKAVAS
jgi:hypothetical protein